MSVSDDFGPIPVNRALTSEEYDLSRWMLENGSSKAREFLNELENARVVALCGCGCASIDFGIGGETRPHGPLEVLAEFTFGSGEENDFASVFVFAVEGKLAGLEITEYCKPTKGALPKPSELRPINT